MASVILGRYCGVFYICFLIVLSTYLIANPEAYALEKETSQMYDMGLPTNGFKELEDQSMDREKIFNDLNLRSSFANPFILKKDSREEGETMDSEHMINDRSLRSGFSNPFILKKNAEEANTVKSGLDYRYFRNPFIFKREKLQRQPFLRSNYQNPFILRRDQYADNYTPNEKMFKMPSILKKMIEREYGIRY